jgi:hypothetical protein
MSKWIISWSTPEGWHSTIFEADNQADATDEARELWEARNNRLRGYYARPYTEDEAKFLELE